jgi:predicted ATP-dependent Lon-type protease
MKKQFDLFRSLILKNLDTIRGLVSQVKELSALIEQTQDEGAKSKLLEIQSTMEDKIGELVKNTNDLFDQYLASMNK